MVIEEDLLNKGGPLAAGKIEKMLKKCRNFIGIIDMSDLDKVSFVELPVSFVLFFNEHWIGVHLSKDRLEILDSTHQAFENPTSEFISFLYRNARKTIKINPVLQSSKTNVCGYYVVYFLKRKEESMKFSKIVSAFTNNLELNDWIVRRLVRR